MKVLIIEDDLAIAEFMMEGFRQNGFTCVHATDGESGLATARLDIFDTAVIDIMLPKLNGLEVIRRLRSEGNHLPIIVLSARGSVHAKIEGLEAGGDDYLAKPFSVAELIARVQALIRRATQTIEPTELRVGNLVLDIHTHRVTRGGERIDLQPLEYQLLEYLMRNKGRVITKTIIMDRVWDYRFTPHTNVVESRICRLRDKIDKEGLPKLIHTVRGFGYVCEEK